MRTKETRGVFVVSLAATLAAALLAGCGATGVLATIRSGGDRGEAAGFDYATGNVIGYEPGDTCAHYRLENSDDVQTTPSGELRLNVLGSVKAQSASDAASMIEVSKRFADQSSMAAMRPGAEVRYEIIIRNKGKVAIRDVVVVDRLPGSLELLKLKHGRDITNEKRSLADGGTLVVLKLKGPLGGRQEKKVTVTARLKADAARRAE